MNLHDIPVNLGKTCDFVSKHTERQAAATASMSAAELGNGSGTHLGAPRRAANVSPRGCAAAAAAAAA